MFRHKIRIGVILVVLLVAGIASTARAQDQDQDQGELAIASSPWAKVYIDGKAVGTTPLRIKLKPRVYRIKLVNPELGQTVHRVKVRPRKTTNLVVRLSRDKATPPEAGGEKKAKKRRGKLMVNCLPWAHVYIDGRRAGTTPLIMELRPGKHRLRLVNPNTKPVDKTIKISAGKTTRLSIQLPPR